MLNPYTEIYQKYNSSEKEDSYRQSRNISQLKSLSSSPEVNIDPVLAGIVEDNRFGCAIIARPNEAVTGLIVSIQSILNESISIPAGLWNTPRENLHMSVLEIANTRSRLEIKRVVDVLRPHLDHIMSVANNGPTLSYPLICFDANAVALTFISSERSHVEFRKELFDSVAFYGVGMETRYHAPSAHITIMRFVEHLSRGDLGALLKQIEIINSSIGNTYWKVSNCEFNYGLIWYGQLAQLK